MGFHLTVFGQHDPSDEQDERIAAQLADDPPRFLLRRCARPGDLYEVVRSAVRDLNAPVRVLDLFDHGGNGHMTLGDPMSEFLFDPDSTGHEVARSLSDLLTSDAHVRLLGCETALGEAGKRMLFNLQRAFGKGIVVLGTLAAVHPDRDFDGRGFRVEREEALLFSSTEAAALPGGKLPPTYDERYVQRIAWRKRIGRQPVS